MIMRSLVNALSPEGTQASLSILIFQRVLPWPDPLFPGEPDVRRFHTLVGRLQRWFQILPLDVAVRQLAQGSLPARAAAITFDDGYADNLSQALPVLRSKGVPATFFIATGYLDGGCMWNDSVIEAIRHTRCLALDLRQSGLGRLDLRTLAQRRLAVGTLLASIKYLEPDQRSQAVAQVLRASKVVPRRDLMLRSDQLPQLRDAGMQLGAHTVSHPILERISDAQARWEIAHSKQVLEGIVAQPVTLFAYPNGKPGTDYAARHVAMVREAGFEAAVSTSSGAARSQADRWQLPRFTPWERGDLRFGLRMLGNLRQREVALAV